MGDIPPNQTIYVNNLNDKISKEELKQGLYQVFSQYGTIMDIVALKTQRMRGQAFIVFRDIRSATVALQNMQGFSFYGKPMRVSYAKSKSDAVAKADGSFVPREHKPAEKRPASQPSKPAEKKQRTDAPRSVSHEQLPPHNILFVENIPASVDQDSLRQLFVQYPGFKDVRYVPGRGVAFVDYEDELQASVALQALNGFRVVGDMALRVNFAKRG